MPYALCLHAADERAVLGIHDERVAGVQVAGEDGAGNERLGVALQVALERARTVDRVIPVFDDERLGGVGHLKVQRAVSQTAAQGGDEIVDDVRQVVARERTEHEDLVQTVEELRPEGARARGRPR